MPFLADVFPGIPFVESPLFKAMVDELDFTPDERRVAIELNERGYAVIDFPDNQISERIDRIKQSLSPQFGIDLDGSEAVDNSVKVHRLQDAWTNNDDVRAIATNADVLTLLGKLYGRRPFPFQTLNFPIGTQQRLHSDSIHFSSIPERFMCGVWLAMEDIHPDAGPLTYVPGSHKWPILNNAMIGRRGFGTTGACAQEPFQRAWDALVEYSGTQQELFVAKKGQALIWAANLLHGGSLQTDPTRSRWSQVTHYYFENCVYYTPSFSDEPLGLLDLRSIVDVGTGVTKPNLYLGTPLDIDRGPPSEPSFLAKLRTRLNWKVSLPEDFNPEIYYRLNPDVAVANLDAGVHYLRHGRTEGRPYRLRTSE